MTRALNSDFTPRPPDAKLSNGTPSSEQTVESTVPEFSTASAVVALNGHRTAVDMAMVAQTEARQQQIRSPKRELPYFPSTESLASSAWSSSGFDSDASDSYAWSTELDSDEESDSDDSSDLSSSLSGSSTSIDEGDLEGIPGLPGLSGLAVLTSGEAQKSNVTMKKMGLPLPPIPPKVEGLPIGFEGLPFSLESLKRDLEKVGRTIIASNVGCVAAERAQTLASINWLANHVPNAVLDHLGNEIRTMLEEEKNGVSNDEQSQDDLLASIVQSDDMSEVSDLSDGYLKDMDFEHGNAPGVKEVVEGSNVAQTGYGDLANFAHAKASSFLPVDCTPHYVPAAQDLSSGGILAGIDEMTGVANSSLLESISVTPEEEKSEPIYGSVSAARLSSLDDILACAGPEDPLGRSMHSQSSMHSGVSDLGFTEHRSASMPSIKMLPGMQSRRASTGGNPGMIGNSFDHRGKSSGIPIGRSTNGTEQSGIISAKTAKTTKSKGVKRLFQRFVKRSKSDTKAMKPNTQEEHDRPSLVDSMNCGHGDDAKEAIPGPNKSETGSTLVTASRLHSDDNIDAMSDDDSEFSESLLGSSADSSGDESGMTGGGNAPDARSKDKIRGQRLPSADTYHCALLFVDISGFTKLSNLLDPESLSKVSLQLVRSMILFPYYKTNKVAEP